MTVTFQVVAFGFSTKIVTVLPLHACVQDTVIPTMSPVDVSIPLFAKGDPLSARATETPELVLPEEVFSVMPKKLESKTKAKTENAKNVLPNHMLENGSFCSCYITTCLHSRVHRILCEVGI